MNKLSKLAILTSIFSLPNSTASAQMMGHSPPLPMTVQQFSAARVAGDVQISVRVERVNRTAVHAELLAYKSDAVSSRTGRNVELYIAEDTPTVMGTARDVLPGAVLFVYGILTEPGHVDVKRLVVDTKFVKVE